jgi:actin-like ATPase involved in cell morphogenesis
MRVLAASFPDEGSARAARTRLIRALSLEASDVEVEALARATHAHDTTVLVGRFEDDVVATARAVVAEFKGTLVVDVDGGAENA